MVTIKDVAEVAGVSTATVSNVIHGNTKKVSPQNVKKIQKIIKDMGYIGKKVINISQNSDSSRLIAVFVNYHKEYEETILSDPFYGKLVGFLEQKMREMGYCMMFYSTNDLDEIFNFSMDWDVGGIITVTFSHNNCEKLRNMLHKPVISIDSHGQQYNVPNIGIADEDGGYKMIEHMLKLGYENIYVCTTYDYGNDHKRWIGAKRAWESCGIDTHKKKMQLMEIGLSSEERYRFYRDIARQVPFKKKTGLFCLSDYMAIEAISSFYENGLTVPHDIGVAGYDDTLFASHFLVPRLTTIHQDIKFKAETAVIELIKMINDKNYVFNGMQIPVSLIDRKSL